MQLLILSNWMTVGHHMELNSKLHLLLAPLHKSKTNTLLINNILLVTLGVVQMFVLHVGIVSKKVELVSLLDVPLNCPT